MNKNYAPPEGFLLDSNSGLYFRDDGYGAEPNTGAPVRQVTWFSPENGEYRQTAYPNEKAQATYSARLKPFVPEPLKNRSVDSKVRGTGYIGLLALFAWLLAIASPIVTVVRGVSNVAAFTSAMADGTINDIIGGISDGTFFDTDSLSGIYSMWDLALELPGGIVGMISGAVILLILLIPMIFMWVGLRSNYGTARVLMIINFCLCMVSDWLCYSVIARVEGALGNLPPPYGGAAQTGLIIMGISCLLWIIAIVFYFIKTAPGRRKAYH